MENSITSVEQSLANNPAAVYLGSLTENSRRTMREALDTIAGMLSEGSDAFTLDWGAVRFQHTAAVRSLLAERYSAATANRILAAMRGVLKAAWRLGYISAEDYARAVDINTVKGETLPKGRALSEGEINALFRACANDKSPAGARDAAILGLLRSNGLRRSEICELNADDYNRETGTLVVRGKGNKEREAYVSNGALDALNDWLTVRGDGAGALFCPIRKDGTIIIRRMYAEAIFNMLRKRAEESGIKNLSPHDFRRTFVSELLDLGEDLVTVQKLAGHSNIATTARYDRRDEKSKRKAVSRLHVPYYGKTPNSESE